MSVKVEVINKSTNPLPEYATLQSAGMDLQADFSNGISDKFFDGAAYDEERKTIIIFSGGRALIPTGLFTAIPEGYEMQIRPRSGLALKNGITVLNTPGTIDGDYRNGWGVVLINLSNSEFEVSHGDRIAQAVLNKFETVEWVSVETLSETERGLGGFGSTGK